MIKATKTLAMALAGVFIAVPALAAGLEGCNDDLVAAGEKQFRKCKACHKLEAGQNGVGPSLHGIVGRGVADAEGYKYSSAMAGFGKDPAVVWDEAMLEKYLADPKGVVSGTKMAFAGIKKEDDRKAVVCYLDKNASD